MRLKNRPFSHSCLFAAIFSFCYLIAFSDQASAAWSDDPTVNTPICTASDEQLTPTITTDGSGGAIIAWNDERSGMLDDDIYVQRVNAAGEVQWTANGVGICLANGEQNYPTITSDGSGGAIIAWSDRRNGTDRDIYAQRVNGSGVAQWKMKNGVAICTASDSQSMPMIISDGSGGAIIAWEDHRNGLGDIYAQRVDASGVTQWTPDGVAICTAIDSQYSQKLISDNSGGAIIAWQDFRNGNSDIYAQRVTASGVAQWTSDGVAICTAKDVQYYPNITSDGSGGAIITWYDYRNGIDYNIYAQRVNAYGVAQWTADGVAICTAGNGQYHPNITSDSSSGAIITWHDYRNGIDYNIYAQRVNASGVVQWTADGVAICTAGDGQSFPNIASDSSGGAIIAWRDYRNDTKNDFYAQRVNASGVAQWTSDGEAICKASDGQDNLNIIGDGSGGAIITWEDERSYYETYTDIYAQRIDKNGKLGEAEPKAMPWIPLLLFDK